MGELKKTDYKFAKAGFFYCFEHNLIVIWGSRDYYCIKYDFNKYKGRMLN